MHNFNLHTAPTSLLQTASLGALSLLVFILIWTAMPLQAAEPVSGGPKDDAYAANVWAYMQANGLIGEQRIRSFPFIGARPHGSIQEVIVSQAKIDGHQGRLIVKHNYGAKKGLTVKDVYASAEHENYEALTIMFQRESGYDPSNNDWFWAEYNPDGSILAYQGQNLSGRSPACLGCHTPLGGKDREILNGTAK